MADLRLLTCSVTGGEDIRRKRLRSRINNGPARHGGGNHRSHYPYRAVFQPAYPLVKRIQIVIRIGSRPNFSEAVNFVGQQS